MNKPASRYNRLKRLFMASIAGTLLVDHASLAGDEYSPGYQYDMRGNIVRDDEGKCIRTSQWSPAVAIADCDPSQVETHAGEVPVREKKARVTSVNTRIDLVILGAGDHFAFDSAELSSAGKQLLANTIARLGDHYIHRIHVAGHTDRLGNDEHNLKLSRQRGEVVKTALVALGMPGERIRVTAHGSDDPLVSCPGLTGEALIRCLAPNRRTEIRLVIPVVSTKAAAEFVPRRRQDEVGKRNLQAQTVAVNTTLIRQGFNAAMKAIGEGCSEELAAHCEDIPVTDDSRTMNCLYEHNPQLSGGCRVSIDAGEATIEAALGSANFFAAHCAPSIDRFCAGIQPVGGKLLDCLIGSINNVEKRCYDAMLETGLRVQ